MPSVAIVVVEGCYVSCAAGFADVMQAANAHLREPPGRSERPFEWHFVSEAGGPVTGSNGLRLSTEPWQGRYDVVVLPAIHYPGYKAFAQLLDRHASTCAWLRRQWEGGAWIGANCTGTFLLAQSGLLDGRVATTTWWLDRPFRSRYPRVHLQFRSALTETDRLVCAGATATFLLQSVLLVERFLGATIASRCAKSMLIDISHTGHIPYRPLLTPAGCSDALVERAQDWLKAHLDEALDTEAMARAMAVSGRTLTRRFVAATGQTPQALLQALRLDAARALLEAGDLSVQAIAQEVGYLDASAFSRLFRKRLGVSPGVYRQRFPLHPR